MKQLCIALFFLLAVDFAQAQTSAIELPQAGAVATDLPENEALVVVKKPDYFSVMVGLYPLPFAINGGISGSGVAAELKPTSYVSAHVSRNYSTEEEDDGFNLFGEDKEIKKKMTIWSLRIYSQPTHRAWYLGAGYLDGEVDVSYRPAFFGGLSASRSKSLHGATAALGYRFEGGVKSYGSWIIDMGISYEPVSVYDISYSGSFSLKAGFGSSNVNFKTGYEILPGIRAGLSF